jgi:prepilin signal peptidase PulO-like enzyme (type II secretory pathway)
MVYLFIFVIGLAFGSFASVIIHRLHTREKGIFRGRSKCPYCANELAARDLIPVVSYLINKFKCRFCRKPIAFRYPLLELTMGGFFLLTAWMTGVTDFYEPVFYLLVTFVFVLLSFYDFLFKEIPDEVSLSAFFAFAAYMLISGAMSVFDLAIGVAIPVLFFGVLHFGSRGRWLGGGDIRIGAVMGVLLGYPMILTGLFFGYLVGAVFSLTGLALGQFNRKTQIPFAPFLLFGTYIAIFWGQQAIDWYFSLL